MSDVREKIENRLGNAHRQMAILIQTQKEELKKLNYIKDYFEKKYDEEMAVLDPLPYDSEEREKQQERVDDISHKLMATNEAIAQFEMNLREQKAI